MLSHMIACLGLRTGKQAGLHQRKSGAVTTSSWDVQTRSTTANLTRKIGACIIASTVVPRIMRAAKMPRSPSPNSTAARDGQMMWIPGRKTRRFSVAQTIIEDARTNLHRRPINIHIRSRSLCITTAMMASPTGRLFGILQRLPGAVLTEISVATIMATMTAMLAHRSHGQVRNRTTAAFTTTKAVISMLIQRSMCTVTPLPKFQGMIIMSPQMGRLSIRTATTTAMTTHTLVYLLLTGGIHKD